MGERKKPRSVLGLSIFPTTGRTHQLRVHLAALNHPIIGDDRMDSSASHCPVAKHHTALEALAEQFKVVETGAGGWV